MMIRSAIGASCMAAAIAATGTSAKAGPEDDTIRWSSDTMDSSLDFYEHNGRTGRIIADHVWDPLIYREPNTGQFEPHLAESWEFVDDTTIEFKLREDVTFHNGEQLTADDVVFTVDYVTSNTLPRDMSFISGAEKIDNYTVRIFLPEAFPPVLEYIATTLKIYPSEYFAEVGTEGMSREPIGSGPYRVTNVSPGESVAMEKYDDYFGGTKGMPTIGTVEFRFMGEFNTQAVELMTGDLDWIWRVPPDARERLENADGIAVESGEILRFGFLKMDAAGRTGDTPFQDVRVRQAVNHAIDREGIRAAMMGPGSNLINAACAPIQFGCDQDVAVEYEYDPDRARELLAEAGYEDGFSTPFYVFGQRPIAEAVIGDLNAVGIDAQLNFVQWSALSERPRAGETPFWFQTWGSSSIGDVIASTGHWFRHSDDDYARDDDVLAYMDQGNTMDQDARLEAYRNALRIISEEAYIVPLFTFALTYAHHEQLEFEPMPDEIPRFYRARWID